MMEASEKQSATSRKGRITEELQQQARKTESPVVSEFLVAARKGFTQHVIQSLRAEGGSGKAAVIDKVGLYGETPLHQSMYSRPPCSGTAHVCVPNNVHESIPLFHAAREKLLASGLSLWPLRHSSVCPTNKTGRHQLYKQGNSTRVSCDCKIL